MRGPILAVLLGLTAAAAMIGGSDDRKIPSFLHLQPVDS
jgi:hypothetical protein